MDYNLRLKHRLVMYVPAKWRQSLTGFNVKVDHRGAKDQHLIDCPCTISGFRVQKQQPPRS